MELTPPPLEHPGVHHVLRQRVFEAVHRLGLGDARKDKVEAVEIPQVTGSLFPRGLQHARNQRHPKAATDDRRALECSLAGLR